MARISNRRAYPKGKSVELVLAGAKLLVKDGLAAQISKHCAGPELEIHRQRKTIPASHRPGLPKGALALQPLPPGPRTHLIGSYSSTSLVFVPPSWIAVSFPPDMFMLVSSFLVCSSSVLTATLAISFLP